MAFKSVFLMVFGSALFMEPISSYSNGHVTKSCRSMKPGHKHHTVPPAMPYSLTVDKNIFKEGDQIKVTLSGTSSFEGFLIQARDASDLSSDATGSFTLVNPAISQRLTCDGTEGSAVSHTSKSGKIKVEVIWNVPASAPSSVQFLFTVVQYYDTFWVKEPGPIITQVNVTYPTQLTSKTVTTEKTATSNSILKEPFSAQGCGTSKSCLQDPTGCDPKKDTKCFFLSFTKEDTSALFEMSGPTEGYVAFALSHDKWMGNDDAYICIRDEDYIDISAASIAGRTHPIMASQDHLTDKSWRYSDGIIQCTFKRDIKIIFDNDRFPLDRSYFLFFADGQAEHGSVHRHQRQPLISSEKKFIIGPPEKLSGSRSPLLIKLHGAFMLIAWITTVSIGVIIARFFKPVWPESRILGEKVWFQVHRILMLSTVLLTAVAFVLPFLYRGGWSKRAGVHPYLGCTVMSLAVLQIIMAILRPPPNTQRRFIFNWAHWGTGTAARIIAVAAMFLGTDLQALDLPDPWDTIALAGFVVWHILTEVVLELHNFLILRNAKSISEDNVKIIQSSHDETQGHCFKKVVLAVYVIGNAACLFALLVAVYNI
ncbi:putative ferric-chelate reductase 1 [Erpetoichthys calabaricus]|uniref:Ferric chelate reductase 1 n=1 Tax=Erpetoichthys calabaricus TaxID=27687 RepID=A0A8C4T187_ERPCA|nr:putative ferric-chelate reductase 1 [Erpetoichthys calabaricus]